MLFPSIRLVQRDAQEVQDARRAERRHEPQKRRSVGVNGVKPKQLRPGKLDYVQCHMRESLHGTY